MRITVSAQVPADAFRSGYEDPVEAAQEFVRFAGEVWSGDLAPLQAAGIGVTVSFGVLPPESPPAPGIDVRIEPYQPDAVDMMQQTRELLTTQADVWDRWLKSPAAKLLYRG